MQTTTTFNPADIRQNIVLAMQNADDQVIELEYRDAKGAVNRRVVSPIRFVTPDRLIALCLCREAPRVFYLKNCSNVALKPAWDYVMPVEMVAC